MVFLFSKFGGCCELVIWILRFRYALAGNYLGSGDRQKARITVERILSLYPENPAPRQILEYLNGQ
jgi:hypothetical protein